MPILIFMTCLESQSYVISKFLQHQPTWKIPDDRLLDIIKSSFLNALRFAPYDTDHHPDRSLIQLKVNRFELALWAINRHLRPFVTNHNLIPPIPHCNLKGRSEKSVNLKSERRSTTLDDRASSVNLLQFCQFQIIRKSIVLSPVIQMQWISSWLNFTSTLNNSYDRSSLPNQYQASTQMPHVNSAPRFYEFVINKAHLNEVVKSV